MKVPYSLRKTFTYLISFIGVLSALLGIYAFFFTNKKVQVEAEVLATTNVFDINTPLSKLDIIYDSMSLKNNHQNLRIIQVRIRNNGNENVLKNYYDDQAPLGLGIRGGNIIEKPEIVATTNDYLKKNIRIYLQEEGRIFFNNVILEAGQSFTLKLLVLHQSPKEPVLFTFGKIAGQNSIPVISLIQSSKSKENFWIKTFSGSVFTQLLRLIVYTFVMIISGILFGIAVSGIIDLNTRNNRKKKIAAYKKITLLTLNKMDEVVFNRFVSDGSPILRRLVKMTNNESMLNKNYEKLLRRKDDRHVLTEEGLIHVAEGKFLSNRHLIDIMLEDGFIFKDEGRLKINSSLRKTLIDLINFVKDDPDEDSSNNSSTSSVASTVITDDQTNK